MVGAGAIGTLVACALAPRHHVVVLVRDQAGASAIRARGGLVVDDGPPHDVPLGVAAKAVVGVDVLLVAVKTYATIAALSPLRAELARDVPIVSLQNGAAATDQISAALGADRAIVLAPTTEAAMLVDAGAAQRTARGRTTFGWADGHRGTFDLEALAEAFHAGGMHAVVADPIEPAVWAKLVVNAAINPVTALAGVPNGAILERPELRERAFAAAREAAAVASALGMRLPYADAVREVEAVARATAVNRSSMLQDLERGRPTEIDELSGAVVRHARALGIPAPENAALCDEVRARTRA